MSEAININAGWCAITGDVDQDHYIEWTSKLNALLNGPAPTITVLYSTEGGDVNYGFALYDFIKAANTQKPITIVINGACYSAGTLILQAAEKRLASPNSSFLLHFGGIETDNAQETKFDMDRHDVWCRLIAKRSKWSIKKAKNMHKGENYLTAEKALKEGLIDEVLKP